MSWLTVVLLAVSTAWSAAPRNATRATLVLSAERAKPGEVVLAGVRLRMEKGWHTYWRNSGDSGQATAIEWTLPPGVTAGPIQWPAPEKLTLEDLTTYVLHDEAVLLVPLTLAAGAARGAQEIAASVSWLECELNCVPGQAKVKATLTIGDDSKPSGDAELFKAWQGRMPQAEPRLQARAWWEQAASGDSRPVLVEWTPLKPDAAGDFFPYENDKLEIPPKTESVTAEAGKVRLRKTVKKSEGDWPKELAGLAVETVDGKVAGAYEVKLSLGPAESASRATPADTPEPSRTGAAAGPAKSLWRMLLLAFVGGLILNIMPCVLPVIALKILGFVKQSREAPGRVRKLGLIYGLGVLVSFLVLAGVVIGVQQAGHRASWGMQFGNPQFLVVLTLLVMLVALNLFGVFEVTLGGGALGTAAELAGKEGGAGAFFNGVLATVLATPCTAPFLGIALGFAFTQPAAIVALMFLTVGAGLALPYVLLSWQPAWLKFLPKPGAWMEKFKVGMGFPMLGTAVWLFTLAPEHFEDVLWLGFFLVLVALAAWVYGEFVQRGRARRGLAAGVAVALVALGYGYGLEAQTHWRHPSSPQKARGDDEIIKEGPDGIEWRRWRPAAVEQARLQGRPVFVDFTAKWCLTCQSNKKTSIEIPSVRAKLKEINAVAFLGDYTKVPADITEELNRFGRAGVPLVLVYPKKPKAEPIVLPEVLTPGLVLRALEKAAE